MSFMHSFPLVKRNTQHLRCVYECVLESNYLGDYPFYSDNDRWFRFIRDHVLGPESYYNTMIRMLYKHNYRLSEASKRLWMSEDQVKHLFKDGHLIGLHSFSHHCN